jgi:hypothetical protein
MKLNLGCGSKTFADFCNVDAYPNPGVDVVWDMETASSSPPPFQEDSVRLIYMSHVLEHIHNVFPLFDSLYRICCNGAILVIRVPAFSSDEAWIDPTHVRPWHPRSFNYFAQPKYHSFDYGYLGDFQPRQVVWVLKSSVIQARSLSSLAFEEIPQVPGLWYETVIYMEAIKPARRRERGLMENPKVKVDFDQHLLNLPQFGLVNLP